MLSRPADDLPIDEEDLDAAPLTPEQKAAATRKRLQWELDDQRDRAHALAELGLAHDIGEGADEPPPHTEIPPGADGEPDAGPPASAKGSPLKLTYFDDCGAFAQKRSILKNIIALGETSAWIAPPGAGKSALLTEISVHCAARIDWR